MAFDFPSAPTVGQNYPSTPVIGQPTYTWDGEKWTTKSAPIAAKTPIYTDGSNPMAAALTLAGDPTAATDAADKHYVDAAVAALIPSGTTMLFCQTSAPIGWTQNVNVNDGLLRVVNGATGGQVGGANGFSTVNAQTTVGNHTLTLGETPGGISATNGGFTVTVYPNNNSGLYMPLSDGSWGQIAINPVGGSVGVSSGGNRPTTASTYCQGTNAVTAVSTNTGGGAHNHPITMNILYVDIILARKN